MLKDVEDVIVCRETDLLSDFMAYVAQACRSTEHTTRPMLVMMFGHGTETSFSITTGGAGEFRSCHRLRLEDFRQAILHCNGEPNVTGFTTACYSGGWVRSPLLPVTANVCNWP